MTDLITILGPTATGKTQVAVALAQKIDAEIISGDSRQVYRRMDLGTGKDLADYQDVAYHLIDICEPGTKYNLYEYQRDFRQAYADIRSRGKNAILCGGTGLYIESILRDYRIHEVPQNQPLRDELEGKPLSELTRILQDLKQKSGSAMHNTTDVDSAQRAIRAIEIETYTLTHPEVGKSPSVPLNSKVFGIDVPRDVRRERITHRLKKRLEDGMLDEIRQLLEEGVPAEDLMYYGLEYKFLTQHVVGELTYEEMFRQLEIAIHQFAKRQMTWFRGMERRGVKINWIDGMLPMDEKVRQILLALDE